MVNEDLKYRFDRVHGGDFDMFVLTKPTFQPIQSTWDRLFGKHTQSVLISEKLGIRCTQVKNKSKLLADLLVPLQNRQFHFL